jgi:hypothetical protein
VLFEIGHGALQVARRREQREPRRRDLARDQRRVCEPSSADRQIEALADQIHDRPVRCSLPRPGGSRPLLLVFTQLYLAWSYRGAFAPLLRSTTAPAPRSALAPRVRRLASTPEATKTDK